MLGVMCLVALLQLVRCLLVFSAHRLRVLTAHMRTQIYKQKILEQTAYQLQQSD